MKKNYMFITFIFLTLLLSSCNANNAKPEKHTMQGSTELDYETEIIADGLKAPWEIVVMPDERFLLTERDGRGVLLENGQTYDIAEVNAEGEGGLLGITLSPTFNEDHLVYLSRASVRKPTILIVG